MALKSEEDVVIPPLQCKSIVISNYNTLTPLETNYMLYTEPNPKDNFRVANYITTPCYPQKSIVIVNPTNKTIFIKKNQEVAKCYQIDAICEDTRENTTSFNNNDFRLYYKGNENNIQDFIMLIEKINSKDLTIKNIQYDHEIKLRPDSKIVNVKPYRTGKKEKEVIDEQITLMLKEKVIRESVSPFNSPIVLVKKKAGSSRFCIDYRQLNNETIKDSFSLPHLDYTIDNLQNAKIYSKIDLRNGYWHIPIRETCKHKTAFKTHTGLYEFKRIPFGLCNAPSTFQRAMNSIIN